MFNQLISASVKFDRIHIFTHCWNTTSTINNSQIIINYIYSAFRSNSEHCKKIYIIAFGVDLVRFAMAVPVSSTIKLNRNCQVHRYSVWYSCSCFCSYTHPLTIPLFFFTLVPVETDFPMSDCLFHYSTNDWLWFSWASKLVNKTPTHKLCSTDL